MKQERNERKGIVGQRDVKQRGYFDKKIKDGWGWNNVGKLSR